MIFFVICFKKKLRLIHIRLILLCKIFLIFFNKKFTKEKIFILICKFRVCILDVITHYSFYFTIKLAKLLLFKQKFLIEDFV